MNIYDVQVRAVNGDTISLGQRISFMAVNQILSDLPEQPFIGAPMTITIEFRGQR